MTTTKLTQQAVPDHLVRLSDGRVLAVDDRGAADGPAVLFLHSAPGSRALDPDPQATRAAGVRLLTVDRPGYGASTPLPADVVPTLAGVADDLAAALAVLGVGEVGVAGWSNGGLVALALAARHPDLVRAVALVGTPAPDDAMPWVGEHRPVLHAMREDPSNAAPALAEVFAGYVERPDTAVETVSGPADEAALAEGDIRARVVTMMTEAFRHGAWGVAADIVAVNVAPWGFDPASVGVPVALHYGEADAAIPPDHGRWWAGVLADPSLRVTPGAGHLLPLTAWADILATVR